MAEEPRKRRRISDRHRPTPGADRAQTRPPAAAPADAPAAAPPPTGRRQTEAVDFNALCAAQERDGPRDLAFRRTICSTLMRQAFPKMPTPREFQIDAFLAIAQGENVIVRARTASGKSVIFEACALVNGKESRPVEVDDSRPRRADCIFSMTTWPFAEITGSPCSCKSQLHDRPRN
jgi:hypothetical protein